MRERQRQRQRDRDRDRETEREEILIVENLIKLLGLNSTTYLQNTCHVEILINKTTRLNKVFGL